MRNKKWRGNMNSLHLPSLSSFRDQGHLLISLLTIVIFFILATVFYAQYENWSILDSVFFVVVTLSTVGYGQPAPSDDQSRLFTIFVIIVGIFVIIVSASDLIHTNIAILKNWLCKSNTTAVAQEIDCGDIYHYRRQMLYSLAVLVVLLVIGASVMKTNENWTWTEAFYFVIETTSTVGYGDMYIKERSSKGFLCVYIVVSTIIIASTIKTYSAVVEEKRQVLELDERLTQLQSLDFLVSQSTGRNVTSHEIVLQVLTYLGKIDHARDVAPILRKLEAAGDTILTQHQVEEFVKRQRETAQSQQLNLEHIKTTTRPKLLIRMLYDWLVGIRPQRLASTEGSELPAYQLPPRGSSAKARGGRDFDDVESPLQLRASADDEL